MNYTYPILTSRTRNTIAATGPAEGVRAAEVNRWTTMPAQISK
ncbi:MAG: hypothetical protein ACRD2U_08645 [Terriglobales bacterium]